ncbi:hypothetical protein [Bryobacter aggregatus]|uniref:hypothetical protein n=1 Tax=Bryobacter aggregatus TaxID=360054 RepID=UPI0004E1879D|nr:hypothetical protein [Bryobacter aggregatus]
MMKKHWFLPGFVDLIFAALIAWLFLLSSKGWGLLLSDGDTGWHIRTGEWILKNHRVPFEDLFSYTRPGAEWFAWEWGADVLFALLHGLGGLPLLVFVCGFVLVATSIVALRWMIWRGSSVLVAFPLMMLAVGGSTMHYLARPHVFTLFLLVSSLWLLDAERRRPSPRIWLLVPLTVLWTNLHGGWPALFVFLGIQIVVHLFYRDPLWRKELLVTMVCAVATLCNPYGWHLHQHILGYLQSSWIRDAVDEFQSPKFRAENLLQFEVLLLLGIATAWGRAFRCSRGLIEAAGVWLWAHLALGAVRHAPIFILAACPVISSELTCLLESVWAPAKRSSTLGIFRDLDADLRPKFAWTSIWAFLLPLLLFFLSPQSHPSDFPEKLFPVVAANTLGAKLQGPRVFTSDQWGDYLLYRFWPSTRVFMDGRSDFFGPDLGRQYLAIVNGAPDWRQQLDAHRVTLVLLPAGSDLGGLLQRDPEWQTIHSDGVSVAFERKPTNAAKLFSPLGLMKGSPPSEGIVETRQ